MSLSNKYFKIWKASLEINFKDCFDLIQDKEWNLENFKFATAVSVMSSSRIEGETLDLDSYVKHKVLNVEYLPNLVEKPNDLYNAYEFAKVNELNKTNFLEAHALASKHLLPEHFRGALRNGNMLIIDHLSQRIRYEAAAPEIVQKEFDKFWNEVDDLLKMTLTIEEIFYYAAFIHLVFVKIHPFNDGNGRIGRLLEKWFLASKLGLKAWFIPSEMYYYQHLQAYYDNLAKVGLFFDELNYEKALPFLSMLPKALTPN
jgi:Fic family protein